LEPTTSGDGSTLGRFTGLDGKPAGASFNFLSWDAGVLGAEVYGLNGDKRWGDLKNDMVKTIMIYYI